MVAVKDLQRRMGLARSVRIGERDGDLAHSVCLLVAGFLLWVVTIFRTVKQLTLLWSRGLSSVSEVAVGREKVSALEDSK